jgi:hypothetical protein
MFGNSKLWAKRVTFSLSAIDGRRVDLPPVDL